MIIQFAHDWIECAASKLSVQSPLAWNDVIRAGNPRLRHLCYHHVTDKGTDAQTLDALAIGGATSISPLSSLIFLPQLGQSAASPAISLEVCTFNIIVVPLYSLSASLREVNHFQPLAILPVEWSWIWPRAEKRHRLRNDTLLSSRHGLKNPFFLSKRGGHSLRSKTTGGWHLDSFRIFSHPAAGNRSGCEQGRKIRYEFCSFLDTSLPFETDLRISI